MFQRLRKSISLILPVFLLCHLSATAMAEDERIAVLRSDGSSFNLDIYNPPAELIGNDPAPTIARYTNLHGTILDVAGEEIDSRTDGELIVLRKKPNRINSLSIYGLPPGKSDHIGQPIASDNNIGRKKEFIAAGNFNSDSDIEIAIAKKKRNGKYKLLISKLPNEPSGNTGRAIASCHDIGDDIVGLSSGNFDADKQDELLIVRENDKLEIYDAPESNLRSLGSPLLSYDDIGSNIVVNGVTVLEFDDAEPAIALARSKGRHTHTLELFPPPLKNGDALPPAIARYSDIGKNVAAVTSLQLVVGDNPSNNKPPKAVIKPGSVEGDAPLTVIFDGSDSLDTDGFIEYYRWNFGNGDSSFSETVDHTFDNPGDYEVSLTVFDNEGAQDSDQILVRVLGSDTRNPKVGGLLPQEKKLISAVNRERQQYNLPPLTQVDALNNAARRHSDDMAEHNFLSHTGSDGSTPWDRMRDAGYWFFTAGENVAAGYSTADNVTTGWMNSSGHRANILNRKFCELGVGYAYNAQSRYKHYWTLDLGCSR